MSNNNNIVHDKELKKALYTVTISHVLSKDIITTYTFNDINEANEFADKYNSVVQRSDIQQ